MGPVGVAGPCKPCRRGRRPDLARNYRRRLCRADRGLDDRDWLPVARGGDARRQQPWAIVVLASVARCRCCTAVLMVLAPLLGAVVLTWWLGAFALFVRGLAACRRIPIACAAVGLTRPADNAARHMTGPGRSNRKRQALISPSAWGRRTGARPSEDQVDESLKESFPASDPPSWS